MLRISSVVWGRNYNLSLFTSWANYYDCDLHKPFSYLIQCRNPILQSSAAHRTRLTSFVDLLKWMVSLLSDWLTVFWVSVRVAYRFSTTIWLAEWFPGRINACLTGWVIAWSPCLLIDLPMFDLQTKCLSVSDWMITGWRTHCLVDLSIDLVAHRLADWLVPGKGVFWIVGGCRTAQDIIPFCETKNSSPSFCREYV
jgi:hypothetical protein